MSLQDQLGVAKEATDKQAEGGGEKSTEQADLALDLISFDE